MKKLINAPSDVVREALQGMAAAHGDLLRVSVDPAYIVRADAPVRGKVAVLSGGGSGHEPLHGGFVGPGMLDAACPGAVFTSPTPDQMLAATQAVNGGAGVLYCAVRCRNSALHPICIVRAETGWEVTEGGLSAPQDDRYHHRRGVGALSRVHSVPGGFAVGLQRGRHRRAQVAEAAGGAGMCAAPKWRAPSTAIITPWALTFSVPRKKANPIVRTAPAMSASQMT